MKKRLLIISFAIVLSSSYSFAGERDAAKGKEVYDRLCSWCHGKDGAGDGPAAEFLNPQPRDFTLGMYKWKSTPYDEYFPSDEDFYRMVAGAKAHNSIPGWEGMNGTSMPGWSDRLSSSQIKDVVAYIKTFAEIGKAEKPSIKVEAAKGSFESGRKLFEDRCSECHGMAGRGDGSKKLKDDWGFRTWPRDLTKGWTFRAGSSVEDIYTRITAGIPGTQMPSFADPRSKKRLSDEERRDVAAYAASLDSPYKKPGDNDVAGAVRVEGELPIGPDDALWQKAEYTSFYTAPQMIAEQRHFTPTIDSLSVKALYNEKEIAFLVEWDDPTRGIPGEARSIELADGELYEDGAAIQFPVKPQDAKPYFGMGDTKPVEIWFWQSEPSVGGVQRASLLTSKGFKAVEERDSAAGLKAAGVYDRGTWKVVFRRALKTENPDKDLQFVEGSMVPVAFALWDGSNREKGSKHTLTTWHWVTLGKKEAGWVWFWPVALGVGAFIGEMLWLSSAKRRKDQPR